MLDKVLNMPLNYLSCFAVVLRGYVGRLIHAKLIIVFTKTKNFPLFWSHTWMYNTETWKLTKVYRKIKGQRKMTNYYLWFFCFFFHFLCFNVPDNKCHKQKWCLLFFTRIKLVACVLACVRAIACIKWRRLQVVISSHLSTCTQE